MTRTKWILITLLTALTLPIIYLTVWLIISDLQVREKFHTEGLTKPTNYYSAAPRVELHQNLDSVQIINDFKNHDYREKPWGTILRAGNYAQAWGEDCQKIYNGTVKCIAFHHHVEKKIFIISADETDKILVLLSVDPITNASHSISRLDLFAQIFAQYLGSDPIIQKTVSLSRIPRACLDAALAIEDPDFLNHQGVSLRGLFRALLVNIKNFKLSQGGSTITQQLVKNHFLSAERTFTRKIKELLISFIVEARIPKDQILETYFNIIYLGQQGSYQIRGIGAAAQFYFDKTPEHLDLADCALIASIINSPGRFSPFRQPKNASARKEKVLSAMLEQKRILYDEYKMALEKPLPQKIETEIKETAPYFIEGVQRELAGKGFHDLSGYSVYTTMNTRYQEAAQKSIQMNLNELETKSIYHKNNISHLLQSVLISSDPKTGEIIALVGGRDHRKSPFNRIFDSSRQVGSIFKPIVYLTALIQDKTFTPLTLIENTAFTHKYEKTIWTPQNYDNSFSQHVPAFYALKESLNIPTARLAIDVGLQNIIDIAKKLGVLSPQQAFPSLSLGAFEMKPIEVLNVYTSLARLGLPQPLSLVRQLEDPDGHTVLQNSLQKPMEQIGEREDFIILNSMLMETMLSGTGKSARLSGLSAESAGKTGTTSNYKDAWFAGFTEDQVTVVWMGYDDNTPVKLSGASGALPIWTQYIKSIYKNSSAVPFEWTTTNELKRTELSAQELITYGVPEDKAQSTYIYIRNNRK